jgi:hypothetical protein
MLQRRPLLTMQRSCDLARTSQIDRREGSRRQHWLETRVVEERLRQTWSPEKV